MSARRFIAFLALVVAAAAAPPLTTIQDVLYKADGSRFTGLVTINWTSFEASDQSNITMHSVTVKVVNGALRVQLVPTTNSTPQAYYSVRYNSDGRVQFEETWSVPSSSQKLRVRDVRVALQGQIGNETAGTAVQLSDVVGLAAELAARPAKSSGYASGRAVFANAQGALEAVSGSLYDCVRVDGSSGPCGSGAGGGSFIDGETPAGLVDGSNRAFTVSGTPSPATSLTLHRNGMLMKAGYDFTLSGSTATFVADATPQAGDTLLASYRVATGEGAAYGTPQVLCSGIGAVTNQTSDTSLGTCTIPSGLLTPGDRVEIRFALEHAGTASGFHFDVGWGSGYAIRRDGVAADALVSGRADVAVMADSVLLSGQSWGTSMAVAGAVGSAAESGASGVTIEFFGRLAASGGDTLALKNYTVIRFP